MLPFYTGWWQKTCQVVGCHLWAWRKESVSNYELYITHWHVSVTITFIIHHTLMCVSNMSNYNINYKLTTNHQRFVQKQNIINICKYSVPKKSLFCLSAWSTVLTTYWILNFNKFIYKSKFMYYIVFETDGGSIFYMFCVAFCWYRNKRSQRTVPTNQVSEFNFTAATGDCNVLYNRLKIKWIREKMWCTRDFSREKNYFAYFMH